MIADEPHPAQSQEASPALAPAESAEKPRTKRRWCLWLLVGCLIGAAAYALLFHAEQLEVWRRRLTRVVTEASERFFHRGQDTAESGKAAKTPSSRVVPVVTTVAW